MSINIDISRIRRVLLADGWHEVLITLTGVSSFTPTPCGPLLAGLGVPPLGCQWREVRGLIVCPVTSILAFEMFDDNAPGDVPKDLVGGLQNG